MGENDKIQTVEEYIASCPLEIQPKLKELRSIIRDMDSLVSEKISWRMPAFYFGKSIIYFGSFKKHIGLYPGPEVIEVFADRLKDYKTSKGAIQFPNNKPLDKKLIQDIILYKINIIR